MAIDRAKRHGYRLLSKGSRFFKTDLFYLTKGGFWLGVSRIVTVLTGLLLSIGFANLLSPEVYGNYRFVLALFGVVGAFTLTGMSTAAMRAAAQGNEHSLITAFNTHLKWSIGMTVVSFGIAGYYFINDNHTLGLSMLIVGAFAPFFKSARLYSAHLIGKKEFKRNTLLGVGRRLIPTISMLGALFLTNSVPLLILVFFASQTFTLLSLYLRIRREILSNTTKNTDQGGQKDMLGFSKHLSVTNFIGQLAGNLDTILLFHFLGAAPVAVYSFAMLIPRQLRVLPEILGTLVFPRFVVRSIDSIKATILKKAWLVFLGAALLTGAYIITAPYIFAFLFPQYMEAVLFSQVAVLGLLLAPTTLYKEVFGAHKKVRTIYVLNTTTPFVRIALLVFLLPVFGIWGAIAALLGTRVFNALASLVLFHRL